MAIESGIDPICVWEYTPYEVQLITKAKARDSKDSLRLAIITAYYTESFSRCKRLPKLMKVLKEIDKESGRELSKGDMILLKMQKGDNDSHKKS